MNMFLFRKDNGVASELLDFYVVSSLVSPYDPIG